MGQCLPFTPSNTLMQISPCTLAEFELAAHSDRTRARVSRRKQLEVASTPSDIMAGY